MDYEQLQSFVRSGPTIEDDPEPSRLYPPPKDKEKKKKGPRDESPPLFVPVNRWGRKNVVVIEQRKARTIALAIDECYCDKDRAAAVSFGYMDIKHELKQKQTAEKLKVRVLPDDSDAQFSMLGMREIKNGNTESGVRFLSKVVNSSSKFY